MWDWGQLGVHKVACNVSSQRSQQRITPERPETANATLLQN